VVVGDRDAVAGKDWSLSHAHCWLTKDCKDMSKISGNIINFDVEHGPIKVVTESVIQKYLGNDRKKKEVEKAVNRYWR